MAPKLPAALILDVNGTLFDTRAAESCFEALGLNGSLVETWFVSTLSDGFAAQTAGTFVPFRSLGAYHLQRLLGSAGNTSVSGEQAIGAVVTAWQTSEMYPDIPPALRVLASAGVQVSVLTNGSAEAIARPVLATAGLLEVVKPLLDISMAQAWKPHAQSYAFALAQLRCDAGDVLLVASHPWDVHGALAAGLRAVYVQRDPHTPYPHYLQQPEAVVPDFQHLAAWLLPPGAPDDG